MRIHSYCPVCGLVVNKSKHQHDLSKEIPYINTYVPVLLPLGLLRQYFSFSFKVDHIYIELCKCFKEESSLVDEETFYLFYDLIISVKEIKFDSNIEAEIVKVEVLERFKRSFPFLQNGSSNG